jgi:hypothetical protein
VKSETHEQPRGFEASLLPMLLEALEERRTRPDMQVSEAVTHRRIINRKYVLALAATAATAIAIVVPVITDDPLRGALAIERHGDTIHVTVEDAAADPEAMTNDLRAEGLPAKVEVVPVSPSLEGNWVSIVNDNLDAGYNDPRFSEVFSQITKRPNVLELPADFSTPFTLVVGRPAEAGERYQTALGTDVDGAYACLGLAGMTPEQAHEKLTSDGYEPVWYYEHSDMPYSEIVDDPPSGKTIFAAAFLGPTTVGVHTADSDSEYVREMSSPSSDQVDC